jgi:hypothetical protein
MTNAPKRIKRKVMIDTQEPNTFKKYIPTGTVIAIMIALISVVFGMQSNSIAENHTEIDKKVDKYHFDKMLELQSRAIDEMKQQREDTYRTERASSNNSAAMSTSLEPTSKEAPVPVQAKSVFEDFARLKYIISTTNPALTPEEVDAAALKILLDTSKK